jgi:PIN domain nuclease of toxin-antitoxin system
MVAAAGFTELAIGADDAELAGALDWEHKDPFDRMLVAQCRGPGLSLVTADAALRGRVEIPIVWAA